MHLWQKTWFGRRFLLTRICESWAFTRYNRAKRTASSQTETQPAAGLRPPRGDFEAVAPGKIYGKRVEDGSYYNMKMPIFDASNRRIGLLVMEVPFTSVNDDESAVKFAESIRSELEKQIPSLEALFSTNSSDQ